MIEQALKTMLNQLNEPALVLSSPLPDKPAITIVYLEPTPHLQNSRPGNNRVERDAELSVYVMVSGAQSNYTESISFLERVARFFNDHPVFLEPKFQVVQYAPGIDQQCNIWTALQAPCRPCLMYKLSFVNRNI